MLSAHVYWVGVGIWRICTESQSDAPVTGCRTFECFLRRSKAGLNNFSGEVFAVIFSSYLIEDLLILSYKELLGVGLINPAALNSCRLLRTATGPRLCWDSFLWRFWKPKIVTVTYFGCVEILWDWLGHQTSRLWLVSTESKNIPLSKASTLVNSD